MNRTIRETEKTTSNESDRTKQISLIKVVKINENDQIIFAKCDSYIMLPWFTLSSILNELDEEKIKNLVKYSFELLFQNIFL